MSPTFNLKDMEELTSNAKQIQDDVLQEILKLNANTEYLRGFLHGSSDKELFKKNVPVVSYDDLRPYIERVANGEPSDVITGKPVTRFILSSGTSGGKLKIFPVNNNYFENMKFIFDLRSQIISKHIEGVQEGKALTFLSAIFQSTTLSGLPVAPAITSFLVSDYFKNRPSNHYISPDEVTLCPDYKQAMYCHFICGLVRRNQVVSVVANFAYGLVGAITFLETHWKEMCSDIRSGHVSEWITNSTCRDAVTLILGGPNSELADLVEEECHKKSWQGIITRLWPKAKFIQTVVTGQNVQYIPILEIYSNNLPLISASYASSETMFGVNPLCRPQDVSYTFMPNMSYFEFIHVDEGKEGEIVDLVNVKLGCFYEPLVTNYFDIEWEVFYKCLDSTTMHLNLDWYRGKIWFEASASMQQLKKTIILQSSDLILIGSTCYADISTLPGHYVFYWELKGKNINDIVEVGKKMLVECCCVMEESFNTLYREVRRKYDSIGALEIRVVKQGTFESLMEFFISQGASPSQYKTPICVNSPKIIALLEEKVLARFFSDKLPPL